MAGVLVGGAGAIAAGFDQAWGIFLVAFSVVAVLYGISGDKARKK